MLLFSNRINRFSYIVCTLLVSIFLFFGHQNFYQNFVNDRPFEEGTNIWILMLLLAFHHLQRWLLCLYRFNIEGWRHTFLLYEVD